jgi:hypothetical protein
MQDDDATPRRCIRRVRTYREASASKEALRRLGIPTSEVDLRVRGLRLVPPAQGLIIASVFGLALFVTSPILGLFLHLVRDHMWAIVATTVLYVPAVLALVTWQVRRISPMGAGCAIPKSVEVAVTPPYAEEASRILETVPSSELRMLLEGSDERNR